MNKFNNISNTELQHIIEEWIKSERDRGIMKRRLIDGITIEKLAEEYDLSVKQVHRLTMLRLYSIMQAFRGLDKR